MKNVNVSVARKVRVVVNGAVKGDKWGKVIDCQTGQVLHTGQLRYIRKVSIGRYNMVPNF